MARDRESRQRPRRREWSGRKRQCRFCAQRRAQDIDYKNIELLEAFTDDRGRIRKARRGGVCRAHQSMLSAAIKRARQMALLPYVRN